MKTSIKFRVKSFLKINKRIDNSTNIAEITLIPNKKGIIDTAHVIIEGKNEKSNLDKARKELTKVCLTVQEDVKVLEILSANELVNKKSEVGTKYEGSASLPVSITVVDTKIKPEKILKINPNADSPAIFAYYQGLHPDLIIAIARYLSFYKVIEWFCGTGWDAKKKLKANYQKNWWIPSKIIQDFKSSYPNKADDEIVSKKDLSKTTLLPEFRGYGSDKSLLQVKRTFLEEFSYELLQSTTWQSIN